jgi:hypothetical protein
MEIQTMNGYKLVLFFVLASAIIGACFATDSSMDRSTLRGLKAINVVVDPLSTDMERLGISRDGLRDSIERKLRDAGIPVSYDAGEFLGLNISAARMRRGPQALLLNLGVYQVVVLNRDKTTKTVAETWGSQTVMAVASKAMDRAVSEGVGEMVDQFVKAYTAANPR